MQPVRTRCSPRPDGLAQAFIIGEEFIDGDGCAHGPGRQHLLRRRPSPGAAEAGARQRECRPHTVFGYYVDDPERFGVVEFDADGQRSFPSRRSPRIPSRNYAVTGLYFYDSRVVRAGQEGEAQSARGELEITDAESRCTWRRASWMCRFSAAAMPGWTPALWTALCKRLRVRAGCRSSSQGIKMLAPEEIAYKNGWITKRETAGKRRHVTARAPTAST